MREVLGKVLRDANALLDLYHNFRFHFLLSLPTTYLYLPSTLHHTKIVVFHHRTSTIVRKPADEQPLADYRPLSPRIPNKPVQISLRITIQRIASRSHTIHRLQSIRTCHSHNLASLPTASPPRNIIPNPLALDPYRSLIQPASKSPGLYLPKPSVLPTKKTLGVYIHTVDKSRQSRKIIRAPSLIVIYHRCFSAQVA